MQMQKVQKVRQLFQKQKITKALQEANTKIATLETENEELVKSRRDQMDMVTELMEEESTVELHLVTEKALPADITGGQINSIIKIIE